MKPPVLKSVLRKLTFRDLRRRRAAARRIADAIALLDQFPRHQDAPRHDLPARLIVSLTSYPARFGTLHLTVKSLLDQSVRADRLLLWVAHDDIDLLPDTVKSLQDDRFRIGTCEDIRNFKKILPTLAENPEAFIVIADDDTYYPGDWLSGLIDSYKAGPPAITFYRGHRPRYTDAGRLAPYRSWVRNAVEEDGSTSQDILATGNGGVLYPPGSLPQQTADLDLIRELCATSDDVWLYFMRQLSGWPIRRVSGPKREFIEWSGTQDESLTALHLTGKKDEHLQAMSDQFGRP